MSVGLRVLSAVALATESLAAEVVEEKSGYELWGMRPRHVAVVNPVTGEDPRWVRSLDGEWEFCAHPNMAERNASYMEAFALQGNDENGDSPLLTHDENGDSPLLTQKGDENRDSPLLTRS